MKRHILSLVVVVSFVALMVTGGCSTGEETPAPFDITGAWQVTFNITGWGTPFAQTLTFTGSISSGIVTGWNLWGSSESGTYTASGNTVSFEFAYTDSWGDYYEWDFNGTAGNDNYMSGTGTYYDSWSWSTETMTWTANRL